MQELGSKGRKLRTVKYITFLFIILLLFACKGRTAQQNIADSMQTVISDSVITDIVEDKAPVQARKTNEVEPQTTVVKTTAKPVAAAEQKTEQYRITFMEIGSKNCIPCKMMQPIMKEIAEEYKGIVKVEFYDLMVDREIGQRYNIKLMPTQVFLNAEGKEFFRHEGFYPKAELAKMLNEHLAKQSK